MGRPAALPPRKHPRMVLGLEARRYGSLVRPGHSNEPRPPFFRDKPAGRRQQGGMFILLADGATARITLSRAEARNAIPLAGWAELATLASEAAASARLLVLAGEPGGAFCAGADVADFALFRERPDSRAEFRLAIRRCLGTLRDLPIPAIALVEGACYGAGVALAMACDIRLAGPGARFATTPAKLGISYPQEDVHRLFALVGPAQAARLLFAAAPIDGSEAGRIGLADFVPGDLEEALSGLAAAICGNDPDSIRTLKRGLRLAEAGIARDDDQDRRFDSLLGSDALGERLARYRARR